MRIGGKDGYARIVELMKTHNVPDEEPREWRVIDHGYLEQVEKGAG